MGFTGGGSSSVIYVIVLTVLNTVGQAAENIGIIFWFQNLGPLNDAYATLLQTGMVYAVFFWLALAGYVFRYRKDGAQFLGKPVWFGWCVLVAYSHLRYCCGGGRIRNGPPDRTGGGARGLESGAARLWVVMTHLTFVSVLDRCPSVGHNPYVTALRSPTPVASWYFVILWFYACWGSHGRCVAIRPPRLRMGWRCPPVLFFVCWPCLVRAVVGSHVRHGLV